MSNGSVTVKELVDVLNLKVVTGEAFLDRRITGGHVGDLLSVVMGKAQEGDAWITVQSHINIVAVAALADVACVIVSEGFKIDQDAIEKASEEDIVLLSSEKSNFAVATEVGGLLL